MPNASFEKQLLGPIGIVLLAAAMWGVGGTAAQVLFQTYGFPAIGLVTIRSIFAGLILLAYFRPKWPKGDSLKLVSYAIFGLLASQLFYYITITYSNVVTALLLEYLFLPMVVIYESLTGRFKINRISIVMILLAVFGIALVVLGGGGTLHLSVTPIALIAGVLAAFGTAYYTLFSRSLTTKHGSWSVTAWCMIVVGLVTLLPGAISLAHMQPVAASSIPIVLAWIAVVVVLGTLLSFGLFLHALQKISGTEATVVATTEPVWAAIASFFVFGAQLSLLQYLGGALMLIAIVVLKIKTPEEKE